MRGYICSSPIYEFENWLFEYRAWGGPWPLKKNGELRKRAGNRFYDMFERWADLPDRENYRIGGGCERF